MQVCLQMYAAAISGLLHIHCYYYYVCNAVFRSIDSRACVEETIASPLYRGYSKLTDGLLSVSQLSGVLILELHSIHAISPSRASETMTE